MALQVKTKIIKNIKVAPGYYKMVLFSYPVAKEGSPGQFLEIKVADGYLPLLRRPFSIHRVEDARIEVFYEVVGEGSRFLSQRKSGEYLDVIGPLGKGFNCSLPDSREGRVVLVAGGMGVAPLFFLAERLGETKTLVLIGAKTKRDILCAKEFKRLGSKVRIATDDGSCGFKGKVTDLLTNLLRTADCGLRITIYACGPRPMLKEISRISKIYNIKGEFSLEEHLACGIGACLGCVVKTKRGFKRVCKEGPVFSLDEIVW